MTRLSHVLLALLLMCALPAWAGVIAGFDNGVGFALNTSGPPGANVAGGVATMTTMLNGQASSLFHNVKQNITTFSASFDYLAIPSFDMHAADGLVFVVQNSAVGTAALGSNGGGLGYQGIGNSVGVGYSIYPWSMTPSLGTTLGVNGALSPYQSVLPVQLTGTGVPVHVDISYDGVTLTQTLTRGVTSFSNSYNIDIAAAIGSGDAYIGFTASTGGWVSTQQVSNFNFNSPAQGMPLPAAVWAGGALGAMGMTLRRRWLK